MFSFTFYFEIRNGIGILVSSSSLSHKKKKLYIIGIYEDSSDSLGQPIVSS